MHVVKNLRDEDKEKQSIGNIWNTPMVKRVVAPNGPWALHAECTDLHHVKIEGHGG